MVHNDAYSSDVTDTVMPLAIDEVVSTTLETKNKQAPPSMFFDNDGNTITPFLGGIAVTDLSGDTISRQATFVPGARTMAAGIPRCRFPDAFVRIRTAVLWRRPLMGA